MYGNKITTSIYGRRLGLQLLSTSESGGSRGPAEFLVGPKDLRADVTTGESTATNLSAWGVSTILGTSAASTTVYTLDAPIPGVRKVIRFGSTDSALYVKMASGCAISGTSLATTGATVIRSSGGGQAELIGLTTALYGAMQVSSTAVNGMGFQATT